MSLKLLIFNYLHTSLSTHFSIYTLLYIYTSLYIHFSIYTLLYIYTSLYIKRFLNEIN